jgi:hypothetical protein
MSLINLHVYSFVCYSLCSSVCVPLCVPLCTPSCIASVVISQCIVSQWCLQVTGWSGEVQWEGCTVHYTGRYHNKSGLNLQLYTARDDTNSAGGAGKTVGVEVRVRDCWCCW